MGHAGWACIPEGWERLTDFRPVCPECFDATPKWNDENPTWREFVGEGEQMGLPF